MSLLHFGVGTIYNVAPSPSPFSLGSSQKTCNVVCYLLALVVYNFSMERFQLTFTKRGLKNSFISLALHNNMLCLPCAHIYPHIRKKCFTDRREASSQGPRLRTVLTCCRVSPSPLPFEGKMRPLGSTECTLFGVTLSYTSSECKRITY